MAQKPSIPKGTRDFSPAEVAKRNYISSIMKHHFEVFGFQPIETPSFENSETLMGKYGEEGIISNYTQQRDKKEREDEERKQNNLLPLVITNKAGVPDSKYYEYRNKYSFTKKGGGVYSYHHDPRSGYTNYKLKDEWISTPVDQATLEKYWAGT